jgi:hypothetical protein
MSQKIYFMQPRNFFYKTYFELILLMFWVYCESINQSNLFKQLFLPQLYYRYVNLTHICKRKCIEIISFYVELLNKVEFNLI